MTPVTISNDVLSLSVSGTRGSSIDSLKVLGTETIDTQDLGREIQTSLFFPSSSAGAEICSGVNRHWLNLQDAGNDEGVAARLFGPPINRGRTISVSACPQLCPYGGELWEGSATDDFKVQGSYSLGPLDYAPAHEIVQLRYRFYSSKTLEFLHRVCDERGHPTIVPMIPQIFFKSDVLSRLFGLDLSHQRWQEHTPESGALYHPSQYRQQAMAWMRSDLRWGVALYGGWTIVETDENNFSAQGYPDYGVNYLALIDQGLGHIFAAPEGVAGVEKQAHLVVGNLDTIQGIANHLYRQDVGA